jgi:potassium-dependent mechanosensitive channel
MKIIPLTPQWLLLLLLTVHFGIASSFAETTDSSADLSQASPTQEITKENLQAKIDALAERKGLDEALKSKVLAHYQAAQDELINIAAFNEQEETFKEALKQAPERSKKLQKDIDQASGKPPKPDADEFAKIPVEELTQRLVIEQDKVNDLDEHIKKLTNELAEQSNRPNVIRQETLKAKQELDDAYKAIKETHNPSSTSQLELDAERIYLKTTSDARTAELNMLDAETSSYSVRLALLKDSVRLLELQKNALSPLISTIEQVLTQLQQQEEKNRQDALSQAEKDLAGKPVVIQDVMRENIQYSQQLQAINNKISHYEQEKTKADNQISEIEANFNSAAKKIDLASLSPPLGKLLHVQRRNLINKDQFVLQTAAIQSETANTNLEQLVIEEKLKKLADIDGYLKQKMDSSVNKKLPIEQRMRTQAELRGLLNDQAELLTKLSIAYNSYLRILGDFDFSRQQKNSKAEKFALYLDERLLWVRSSEAVNMDVFNQVYQSVKWLLSPHNWKTLLYNVAKLPAKQPLLMVFAVFNIIVLLLIRKWLKQRLKFISEKVGKIYTDNFYYTPEALVYTMLLIAPLPLTMGYLGWFLTNNVTIDNFTQAIGMGLSRAALAWFFWQFLYRLFEPTAGIMRKHFQFQENTTALMRKYLAWLRFFIPPASFIIKSTLAADVPVYTDSLGRLALHIWILGLVFFLSRVFHPKHGLLQYEIINHPHSWLTKLRYIFYGVAFAPLIIMGFSMTGYYLSAVELMLKVSTTILVVATVIITYELVLRWMTIVNRQLAIKNLQQKRKQASTHEKTATIEGSENPILPAEEHQIDIPKINAQSITILNVLFCFSLLVAFWVIWKNIFPAFSFLERIELWQTKAIVDNKEVYQSITLVNLFLAGIYTFIAAVAVHNFSGVMELLVFRRLDMEAGSRYAVNQLANYTLMTIGFFAVANELGFSWSQVQWLVAALSVGLGFGLQEIFANFVSGIILLFERPIRVGDTVTIANTTGRVSRIHMRATTLIDPDQKELIVPNKTFITTQLVNWSLSDSVTRVVITVGIAYDSDIELAHKVMLEAIHSAPLVLKEPEPSVLLVAFADSALEFSIRVFVSETANRMPVTHDLHTRLIKALSEHNIEIPFPQRDIHIRSSTPEWGANKIVGSA